jgi:hypothetical protein
MTALTVGFSEELVVFFGSNDDNLNHEIYVLDADSGGLVYPALTYQT